MTAQCIYCVPTIPTSFQPHPPQTVPHPHTHSPSTIITILNHTCDTISPFTTTPSTTTYILQKTHPTLQATQTFTATLFPAKLTPLTNPTLTSTNQFSTTQLQHAPHSIQCPLKATLTPTRTTTQQTLIQHIFKEVANTQPTLYQTHPHGPPLQTFTVTLPSKHTNTHHPRQPHYNTFNKLHNTQSTLHQIHPHSSPLQQTHQTSQHSTMHLQTIPKPHTNTPTTTH